MGVNEQMAVGLIRQQQEGLDETMPAFFVGEQLLDIIRGDEHAAGILAADLANNKEMSLIYAEKKIKAWADKHKKGNCAVVPPKKAEEILREFYGLAQKPVLQSTAKEISLEDFF